MRARGEEAAVPQRPSLAAAVLSWTSRLILCVLLPSLRVTAVYRISTMSRRRSEYEQLAQTFFLHTDAFDDDKNLAVSDLVSAIDEVLQRHQTSQWPAFAEAERLDAERAIVAVLVEH